MSCTVEGAINSKLNHSNKKNCDTQKPTPLKISGTTSSAISGSNVEHYAWSSRIFSLAFELPVCWYMLDFEYS